MGNGVEQIVRGRENLDLNLRVKVTRRRVLLSFWKANRKIICRKLGTADDWRDAGRHMKLEGETIRKLNREINWQSRYISVFVPLR